MNEHTRFHLHAIRRQAGACVSRLRRYPLWRNERGTALVFALFGLITLTILGLGLTGIGMSAVTVSTNEAENAEALAIADAGISHAKRLLLWQDWMSFDQFLQDADGNGCTGDELSQRPINGTGGYPSVTPDYPSAAADFIATQASGGSTFGVGKYYVVLCDDVLTDLDKGTGAIDANPNHDANRKVIVRSTGVGRNGSTATIESVIGAIAMPAIFVNGNVSLSGNATASGDNGAIYANGTMDISGNPCASQYFMSTGTATGGSNAEGGTSCTTTQADVQTGAPVLPVPNYLPTDFEQYANFKLDINGNIYTRASLGAPWVFAMDGSKPANKTAMEALIGQSWTYENGASQKDWKINSGINTDPSSKNVTPGTYYIAGTNVVISGSPGSEADPVVCTLLVDGWVNITGSPAMQPALTLDWFGGIAIIAGTDIEMGGSSSAIVKGLYYAHDQVNLTGTVTLTGQVVAANLSDNAYPSSGGPNSLNLVPYDGAMKIGHNTTVKYDGGGMAGVGQLSWRECRGADSADPCGPLSIP